MALGLDESDVHKIDLKLYTDHFQRPFIEAAKEYYEAESKRFINENSVTDYMKKASMQ